MKDTYHIINSHFIFFLRKRLTAESSAVRANIGIVSKIIFSSIAIEVSVLIFQENQIWQMLIFKCWEGIVGDNWSFGGKQFVKE